MPILTNYAGLKIETVLLVAIWKVPFIFQGCINIKEVETGMANRYYFRCRSHHSQLIDILDGEYSSSLYEYTHMFDEAGAISMVGIDENIEYALGILKYALHVTINEKLRSTKIAALSESVLDMDTLSNIMGSILNQKMKNPANSKIGFAVEMEFRPLDESGQATISTLLNSFQHQVVYH